MNSRLQDKCNSCKPFAWGYFQAYTSILGSVMYIGYLIFTNNNFTDVTLILIAIFSVYFVFGIFASMRHRMAFVILTILSVNPLLWLINGIYIKNRWPELAASTHSKLKAYSPDNQLDIQSDIQQNKKSKLTKRIRIFIVVNIVWIVLWTGYLGFVEPFGLGWNDEETLIGLGAYFIPTILYFGTILAMKFISAGDN